MVYDASMRPPARMTDDRRQQLQALMRKPSLTGLEAGQLRELARNADPTTREEARAHADSASRGRSNPDQARQLAEAIGGVVGRVVADKVLDAEGR